MIQTSSFQFLFTLPDTHHVLFPELETLKLPEGEEVG